MKCGFFKVGTLELNGHCARIVQPMPTVWPYICEKFPFTIETPHFKSESPEHDVRATEVFMRFEKLECYRTFFTENLLQSSLAFVEDERFADVVRMQPDGVLIVSDAKKTERVYAVELELSKKSPARVSPSHLMS